ncbi:MAG: hypothetical protein IKY12_05080 [Clostridia bacterium]|nr:hypothetical protein [Clostridia bacterium]
MSEYVTDSVCRTNLKLSEERFLRDKERLEKAEAQLSEITKLTVKMSELIERNTYKTADCDERLKRLEKRPENLIDRVVSALISAAVSTAVAIIVSGGAL